MSLLYNIKLIEKLKLKHGFQKSALLGCIPMEVGTCFVLTAGLHIVPSCLPVLKLNLYLTTPRRAKSQYYNYV